jgi:hypothetical protein
MVCYECSLKGLRREAVGLCHHCSAGLCLDHVVVAPRPVTVREPIEKTVVLPIEARELLCATCHAAQQQAGGVAAGEAASVAGSPSEPVLHS